MSTFIFPQDRDRLKYNLIKNVNILLSMLQDDAKDNKKEVRESRGQKLTPVNYQLKKFNNRHVHNQKNTQLEDSKRSFNLLKNKIFEQYDQLNRDNISHNLIKTELKRRLKISERQVRRILNPFIILQRQYTLKKQEMRNMKFSIIQKFSDLVDLSNCQKNRTSYIEFPNQFTVITPMMIQNYLQHGQTVYFGLYPEYISQSKKLMLCGGFYGLNLHHQFIPFAFVLISITKKQEEISVCAALDDILQKQDEELTRVFISILRAFFNYYSKIKQWSSLLIIRQNPNTQAAIYEIRSQYQLVNYIFCFRQKLQKLQVEVGKRYLNDSYSSQEKLDFIHKLEAMVKTFEDQQYDYHLKDLFQKANTSNTLLLQKIMEDSHLFCFSKIKEVYNNLCQLCIDHHLKQVYEPMLDNSYKSKHVFMSNVMKLIIKVVQDEIDAKRTRGKQEGDCVIVECSDCQAAKSHKGIFMYSQIQLFEMRFPELKHIKEKVCVKTFRAVLQQMVKSFKIKGFDMISHYNQKQYLVYRNGLRYQISLEQNDKLSCSCLISAKYGIPCSHEIYICVNQNISIEKQLETWIIPNR